MTSSRLHHLRAGAVPYWAFFLTVLLLIGAMATGYLIINGNTNSIKTVTDHIATRSAQRDKELCDQSKLDTDQAHLDKALTPYVLPKHVRNYINKYLHDVRTKYLVDINQDSGQCNSGSVPKGNVSVPRITPSAPAPRPATTVTRTTVTPGGTKTVTVTVTPRPGRHHRHSHPSPSPTSVLCVIPVPSPVPHVGGCK